MKKIYFLFLVIICILISSTTFSKEVQIIKYNGHRAVLTFWKVTYYKVQYTQKDANNNLWQLWCENPGNNNCRKTASSGKPIVIGMNEYSEELFNEVLNEIMDMVDESIFNGKSDGSVGKKIVTNTIGGKEKTLAFSASWKNADVKTGDVKYSVFINEIEL